MKTKIVMKFLRLNLIILMAILSSCGSENAEVEKSLTAEEKKAIEIKELNVKTLTSIKGYYFVKDYSISKGEFGYPNYKMMFVEIFDSTIVCTIQSYLTENKSKKILKDYHESKELSSKYVINRDRDSPVIEANFESKEVEIEVLDIDGQFKWPYSINLEIPSVFKIINDGKVGFIIEGFEKVKK